MALVPLVATDTISVDRTYFVPSGERKAYLDFTVNGVCRINGSLFCNDLIIGGGGKIVINSGGEIIVGMFA